METTDCREYTDKARKDNGNGCSAVFLPQISRIEEDYTENKTSIYLLLGSYFFMMQILLSAKSP